MLEGFQAWQSASLESFKDRPLLLLEGCHVCGEEVLGASAGLHA